MHNHKYRDMFYILSKRKKFYVFSKNYSYIDFLVNSIFMQDNCNPLNILNIVLNTDIHSCNNYIIEDLMFYKHRYDFNLCDMVVSDELNYILRGDNV